MRRIPASAALAASLLAADLVLLALFLNPGPVSARDALALVVSLLLPAALFGTLALLLFAVAGVLLPWPRPSRPLVEGLPWFTTFAFAALCAAATLFWLNLDAYGDAVPAESARGLHLAARSLTAAALVLLAVASHALLRPGRRRGLLAGIVVLAAASAVVVPLALRPHPTQPAAPPAFKSEPAEPRRRVVLVGVDGLSPELLREALAGRLPTLARLVRAGASGALAPVGPLDPPSLWTSVVTGKRPREHGVKGFSQYRLLGSPRHFELLPRGAAVGVLERLGLVTRLPVTAASRRSKALWNDLNAFAVHAGVVRLFGTHPAEPVQGFVLSNYFHLLAQDPVSASEALHPKDLLAELRARAVGRGDVDANLLSRFLDVGLADARPALDWRRELLDRALGPDLSYWRAGQVLRAAYDPPFFALYAGGLDVVGHAFLRYARPEAFGDVPDADARRYGRVMAAYTELVAERLAELASALRPDELMLVVSTYGLQPEPPWRRALAPLLGGSRSGAVHAGPGVVLVLGAGVRKGAAPAAASLLDIAPTVLYLMGLPLGRDMEGRVLFELFEEDLVRGQPLTFIPSYESLAAAPRPLSQRELPPLPEDVP